MTPSRPGPGGPAIAGTATASTATAGTATAGTTGVVLRHALPDRLFHWLSAACVLTLLATAFLPILGVQFAWVTVHWVTGLVLAAAVLFHVVRVTARVTFGQMWVGRADIADAVESVRAAVARRLPAGRPGKYSVAQKLIHHAFAAVVLTTLVTGGFMLARIDTPWWQRNPYFLGEQAWAAVYVLHGLAALLLITMVMMHVYFALRPEKLKFTRAMIRGWITRQEFAESHDPNRWQVDR